MFQISVTTPMELLKIQMQDQGRTLRELMLCEFYARLIEPGQKKITAIELITKILKTEGFTGLYRGLSSTLARDVTFSMMYFPLFAHLDSLVN